TSHWSGMAADFDMGPPQDDAPFNLQQRFAANFTSQLDSPVPPDELGNTIAATIVTLGLNWAGRAVVGVGSWLMDWAATAWSNVPELYGMGSLGGGTLVRSAGARLTAQAIAPSSRALGTALEEAGFARGEGEAAHHIVAGSADVAAPARAVLQRFGIGINDAA